MPRMNAIICLSEGSYSDYGLMGHFKVLEDFDMRKLGEEFLTCDRGTEPIYEYFDRTSRPYKRLPSPVQVGSRPVPASTDAFQAFLMKKNLVIPFDVEEYHLGDYTFEVPDNC